MSEKVYKSAYSRREDPDIQPVRTFFLKGYIGKMSRQLDSEGHPILVLEIPFGGVACSEVAIATLFDNDNAVIA